MTDTGENAKASLVHSLTGQVTSVNGQQTIHVTVSRLVKEPRYGKFINRRTKLAVHDASNQAHLGDTVEVVPCRRLSKTKTWRLSRVLKTDSAADVTA